MRDYLKILLVLINLNIFHDFLYSQPQETLRNLNRWQIKEVAKHSLRLGDVYSAIEYYEALLKYKPYNYSIKYELAKLYQKVRNYQKAEELFNEIYQNVPEKYPEALFYRALNKKMLGEYDDAKEDFNLFLKKIKGTELEKSYKKLTNIELEGIELAKKFLANPTNIFIIHLDSGINKPFLEASPVPYKGGLLYTSIKKDKPIYFEKDSFVLKRKIFFAKKIENKYKTIGIFDNNIDDDEYDVCNPAFSPDKKRLYFNKCYKNWKNKYICHIYMSEYVNGKWSIPIKLGGEINLNQYTSTQPTIGIDPKTGADVLYFVSDRKGSIGGLDIWYSVYDIKKGTFKTPKNLGKKINTPLDEITPFYDYENKILYFSSNGLPNIGGFDIYKAYGELKQFSSPENLGYPTNSSVDDIYFINDESEKSGYFVSNRKGSTPYLYENCCFDIFKFLYSEQIKLFVKGKVYAINDSSLYALLKKEIEQTTNNDFYVDSSKNIKTLSNVNVYLYLNDQNNNEILIKNTFTNENGEYIFSLEPDKNYKLVFKNFSYFDKIIKLSTKGYNKSDTIIANAVFLNVLPTEPIIIKNIYFKFDKWELTDSAKLVIDTTIFKLLVNYPKLIVEIKAHTDSLGNEKYNLKLSQKRAQSVVNYLISKGIEPERLIAKGYGSSKPIAPNFNPDGTDNPEGRKKNRRVEFQIIGNIDEQKIIYED